ncbi:uncharacterized protein LOC107368083 [Tetranychus urticae]|uniref:Gustatory receptor n=1 Tax=Tetranychus urticae TaxID=32264 RepID=T1KXE5_TETUR|nr:uncharacterized protein LOC107368083 [Tetranychus urticae]
MDLIEAFQSFDELSAPPSRLFLPAISKFKNKINSNQIDSQLDYPYFGINSITDQPILSFYLKQPKIGFILSAFLTLNLLDLVYNFITDPSIITGELIVYLIKLVNGLYSLVLVYLFLVRPTHVNELITIWKSLSFGKYKQCYEYFNHNRKKFHIVIYIVYVIIGIHELIQLFYSKQSLFGYIFNFQTDPIKTILAGMVSYGGIMFAEIILLSQDLVLVDTCFLVYSALRFIRTNLGQFNNNTINRSILRYYREKYTLTCDLIISANNYSKLYIFAIYSSYTIILITRVYFTYFIPRTIKYVFIASFFHLNHLIDISVVTYLLTKTHSLAQRVQEDLYPLTFKTDKISSLYEVMLFMYRVGRQDVGFTFGNLFVMTPNFISSLVTISATLIIAIPSFVPYSKKS